MCLNPYTISGYRSLNPLRSGNAYMQLYPDGHANPFPYAAQRVGCGHCFECVSLKQNYMCQRAELMATDHYVFMQTLTVKDKFFITEKSYTPAENIMHIKADIILIPSKDESCSLVALEAAMLGKAIVLNENMPIGIETV